MPWSLAIARSNSAWPGRAVPKDEPPVLEPGAPRLASGCGCRDQFEPCKAGTAAIQFEAMEHHGVAVAGFCPDAEGERLLLPLTVDEIPRLGGWPHVDPITLHGAL